MLWLDGCYDAYSVKPIVVENDADIFLYETIRITTKEFNIINI